MKKYVPALLAVGMTISLAACGSSDEGSSSGSSEELMPLNIADIKIAAQTDAYAAEKLGFFEKHGLDVEFTYAASGQDILTAVESGQQDVGLAIPGLALMANATAGFDYVGLLQDQVAHEEGPDTGGLIVSADSDIEDLKDLEGRSVAVVATGANQVYVSVVKVLTDAGVDVSKVNFQQIPFPQMGAVLAQGQVDAVANVDPFTTGLLSSGDGRLLSWYYVDALPGMPLGTYWATQEWADSHSAEVAAFQAAMHEAVDYLNANPDEARDLIAEFTGLDRALLDEMPLIKWDTNVSTDIWEQLGEMYQEQGLISDSLTAEDLLVESALKPASN
jgi:NitT/TauT family transport system substrate-binding protein